MTAVWMQTESNSFPRAGTKYQPLPACAWQLLIRALLGQSGAFPHVYPAALEILWLFTMFFLLIVLRAQERPSPSLVYPTFMIICTETVGNENLISAYCYGSAFKSQPGQGRPDFPLEILNDHRKSLMSGCPSSLCQLLAIQEGVPGQEVLQICLM